MIFAKIILLELNNELNGNKIGPEQNIKIKENMYMNFIRVIYQITS